MKIKINDKITSKEFDLFLNQMGYKDPKTRWEMYFPVRTKNKRKEAIKHSEFITARKEGKLVGVVRIVTDKSYFFYITDVMVLPGFRNRGIATKLLNKTIKYCKKGDYVKIFLQPVRGLEHYYSKFGFEISPYVHMVILRNIPK